jgi:predicted nucleic acid-binding protein
MSGRAFIDTNVLVYLYSNSEKEKQTIAKNIILESDIELLISTQVLGEFTNILYRKYNYSIDAIKEAITDFKENFSIITITIEIVEESLDLMARYKYSYWDSLIIAAAIKSNCSILYSEDCQHNQVLEKKLKIINPFKSENHQSLENK